MKKNKEVNTEEVMETPPLVPKKKEEKEKMVNRSSCPYFNRWSSFLF